MHVTMITTPDGHTAQLSVNIGYGETSACAFTRFPQNPLCWMT